MYWCEHFVLTKPTQEYRSQPREEPLNHFYPMTVFQISWATPAGTAESHTSYRPKYKPQRSYPTILCFNAGAGNVTSSVIPHSAHPQPQHSGLEWVKLISPSQASALSHRLDGMKETAAILPSWCYWTILGSMCYLGKKAHPEIFLKWANVPKVEIR